VNVTMIVWFLLGRADPIKLGFGDPCTPSNQGLALAERGQEGHGGAGRGTEGPGGGPGRAGRALAWNPRVTRDPEPSVIMENRA